MAEVPKIVRARLAVKADAGTHPDADLLTAFAERSLLPRERETILAHLSQCAECREVVVLAAPASEQIVLQPGTKTRWLGWPVLRWGALAVCGVVVVAAVSLRHRSEQPAVYVEKQQAALQNEATTRASVPPTASPEKDRVAMDLKSRADTGKTAAKDSVVRHPAEKEMFVAKAKPVPVPAAPPTESKVAVSAGNLENKPSESLDAGIASMAAAPAARDEVAAQAPPAQAQMAQANLGKAKPASNLAANAFDKSSTAKREAAGGVPAVLAPFAYKKTAPRWTLSADGTLQRSLDAGKTWKTIPVSADATFTAVAAMDADIWVGGTHGALYHSIDAGEHWVQVVPSNGGQPLTSNIIGIEFTDTLHGKISTSSQEVWTTSDGGQAWQVSR